MKSAQLTLCDNEASAIEKMTSEYSTTDSRNHNGYVTTVIIPVDKKGSSSDPGYYRGIALMSVCTKLCNKMLLNDFDQYLTITSGRPLIM